MLTHTINKGVVEKQPLFRGKNGSIDHKRFIHERTLRRCQFTIGESVMVDGKQGVITNIVKPEEFDSLKWNGLRALPVEVWVYETSNLVCKHPKHVHRIR